MGASLTKPVNKEENDAWLSNYNPVRGDLTALLFGIGVGCIITHPSIFTLQWERERPVRSARGPWQPPGASTWRLRPGRASGRAYRPAAPQEPPSSPEMPWWPAAGRAGVAAVRASASRAGALISGRVAHKNTTSHHKRDSWLSQGPARSYGDHKSRQRRPCPCPRADQCKPGLLAVT